uniref:RAN GTPase-activating protein 2-like n=1 Tax=Erigeron canadensis TaxID=72917 RepID=UPI001CB8D35B|nr:RAN GTPase-activating protein 2-like [Erigeron canadensis]
MDSIASTSKPITSTPESSFDISGGCRAFIEPDGVEELLKPLIEAGSTSICFSNCSFGLEAAVIAAPILLSISEQLTEVDLSDFMARRPETEALEVITIFSEALQESDLRYLNISNNALGEKGVRAFGQLLRSQCNLEELYLMNDGISEQAAKAVCDLIPSTKKLKVLHFHNDMTGDEGAISIARLVIKSPVLEDFRCSSTRVGPQGGFVLSEALGNSTNLKKLDLRDNMFGVIAGIALSESLLVFSNLTEVYLSYLSLEDEGTIAIVNALKNSASALEVLEMAGNDITSEAAPALAACLTAKNATLTKLVLSENELKDIGAIVIANALFKDEFGKLTEVDLSTNEIRTAGARVLSQAVVGKPWFKLLNINGNYISDEGVDNLKEIFRKFPNVLGPLDDNDPEGEEYDDDTEDELESKLKDFQIK